MQDSPEPGASSPRATGEVLAYLDDSPVALRVARLAASREGIALECHETPEALLGRVGPALRALLLDVDLGGPMDGPEVARALAGSPGRYARRIPNLRGFGLFIAEPVRASPASPPQGVVYVLRSTYPVLLSLYWVRNALIKVALGSLAVGTLVAIFLSLTISRPLRRPTEAAGRIAAGERGAALNPRGRAALGEPGRDLHGVDGARDVRDA